SFRYRLLAGDADSGWRSVELVTPPELILLDGRPSPQVHLTFPAYTDLPPRDLPDGGRVIKAVVGTVVRLRAATDRPIDHAALIYKPRDPDPTVIAAALAPVAAADPLQVPGAALAGAAFTAPVVVPPAGDGRLIEMTFVPRLSGTYLLSVVDATGIGGSSEFDVRVLPDPAPRVTLERPAAARDSLAVLPDAVITLAVKAEDQLEDLPGAVR